ncbi:hypothetical protein DNTS_032239 [Danionella cerebrum]|uniref:Uncharacterized protein n=1 Tax=Danionella cerebrum TaxID=2873325 RepID=A0A553NIR4_9TELE|nr:hypothetical protein DNTS_032239 [Danionella translucida]
MASVGVPLINMAYWQGGKRRIRFIYLTKNDSFQILKQDASEDQMIPLFLGADLFSGTDVRSENQPRYHARFAKRGLATKLVFSSDCRFQGLRLSASSNSLWFYSVHGVFRVAFELYSRRDQLSVMESFQDLWKSRIDDTDLNLTYHLNAHDFQPKEPEAPLVSEAQCAAATFPRVNSNQSDTSRSEDHNYCSTPSEGSLKRSSSFTQKLHRLLERVRSLEANIADEQLNTASKLLDCADGCFSGRVGEDGLTDAVMALFQARAPGASVYSSGLLTAVSGWLGQQFSAANSSISERVEAFKAQHIEHITNLPPPEDLATQLFPEAMRHLLTHWMGLSDESQSWKRHSEYPIVLLILEFANHNLVTGVAHVLYSSLICK